LLESTELQMLNLEGQKYLVQIACVDDVEVFKICLEYFNFLVLFNYLFLALLCYPRLRSYTMKLHMRLLHKRSL